MWRVVGISYRITIGFATALTYVVMLRLGKKNYFCRITKKNLIVMAKIKFGAIVVDGRNKIGGHVLAKNKAGNYMRTKTTPVNPSTTFQTEVRSIFGDLASGWSSLTEAQRDSFNARVSEYAKTDIFGDLRNPSGKTLYQQLNQNLRLSGQGVISTCPAPSATPFLEGLTATADVSGTTFSLEYDNNLVGYTVLIYSSGPVTQGTNFVKNKLRLIRYADGTNGGVTAFWTQYVARFGAPVVGQKIFVATRTINTGGGASPLQTVIATIAA